MSGNQWQAYKRACAKYGKDSQEAQRAYNKYTQSMANAGQQNSIKSR